MGPGWAGFSILFRIRRMSIGPGSLSRKSTNQNSSAAIQSFQVFVSTFEKSSIKALTAVYKLTVWERSVRVNPRNPCNPRLNDADGAAVMPRVDERPEK